MELSKLDTEQRNERSMHIDTLSTMAMLQLINEEDHRVAEAVRLVLPQVAEAVDLIYAHMADGGRLIYCGAGTSGRLGVLDAAECTPTFGVDPGLVVGLIAGGAPAFIKAVEGAEDSPDLGAEDLRALHLNEKDVLVGIAASGRTPYVLGAMAYARSVGAPVIALVCSRNSEMAANADISIEPLPGPEVITGSSRMKSGTAQKLVLNMLSTATMIKLGKVYGNLMVDVKATNEKLTHRAISIVRTVTGADEPAARQALEASGFSCKTAIVMLLLGLDANAASAVLAAGGGHIARALAQAKPPQP